MKKFFLKGDDSGISLPKDEWIELYKESRENAIFEGGAPEHPTVEDFVNDLIEEENFMII